MASGKITKRAVDDAPTGFLWDQDLRGFGLKVTDKGSRSYVFQYRLGGREAPSRRYTIGTHGSPWTPASARREAERLSVLARQGIDPRQQARERQRQAVDLAFDRYAAKFLEMYVKTEWRASYAFAEGILRLHVIPVLADKPLPTIVRSDIAELLDRLPASKPALRRNAYAVVRRLFRWAAGRGDIDGSPLDHFEAPSTVPSRDRVLSDVELREVWEASALLRYPFGPMFRLLIATGQRREEVAALTWQELNRATATWLLPATRAKNGSAHLVPLNSLAIAILDELGGGQLWAKKGYVFTTTGSTAASGHSRAKRRLDHAISELRSKELDAELATDETIPAWRVHDLRRTVATGFQRLGVRFEVTEAVLNHVSGARSGVAGVYQRHDWAAEKRQALEQWADHLSLVCKMHRGKVVALISVGRA